MQVESHLNMRCNVPLGSFHERSVAGLTQIHQHMSASMNLVVFRRSSLPDAKRADLVDSGVSLGQAVG